MSALVACGGGGGDDDDDTAAADAAPAGTDAAPTRDGAPPVTCLASSDYGSATLAMQYGEISGTPATPTYISVLGSINADAMPDGFAVELYKGQGAFTGEIVPGTYPLSGAELNYATCGVCVRLFTDYDGSAFVDDYFATGGTVTITQVNPRFEGSVSNIPFEHATIDEMTFQSTPPAGACTSAVTDTPWTVPPAAREPPPPPLSARPAPP